MYRKARVHGDAFPPLIHPRTIFIIYINTKKNTHTYKPHTTIEKNEKVFTGKILV